MTRFPNSTSGGIASNRKSSKPKPKGGGAINIIEPKAKKSGSMSIKVNVEKIVIGDPKAAGITKPGDSSYRKRG